MWEYRATLPLYGPTTLDDLVHDGDTVRFLLDLGFDDRAEKWIRFADVRAPETNQIGNFEMRTYVKSWLARRAGLEGIEIHRRAWPFRIVTEITRTSEPTEKTSFARYVGTVFDLTTGECLNELVNNYLSQHPEWPAGKALP